MLALLLLACVGRGHHELVVMQLDATRTAHSAQQVQSREDLAARDAEIEKLRDEIHTRQAQLDLLDAQHGAHEAELVALRERYAVLLAEQAAAPVAPTPEPPKKGPKGASPPPCPERPALTAAVADMSAALAVASEQAFTETRASERHDRVADAFGPLQAEGFVAIEQREGSTVVVILAAKLFNEGTVTLSPRGEDIAQKAAVAMGHLHGWNVEIQGHTDATPFHTPEITSNWELGFARGVAVLRALRDLGVDEPAHVASYADTVPRAPKGAPEAAREDARVELWLSEIPGIERAFAPTPKPPEAPPTP